MPRSQVLNVVLCAAVAAGVLASQIELDAFAEPAAANRPAADQKKAGLDWWSLQPVTRPVVPKENAKWIRGPIDAFVLAKLRKNGVSPAAEADRATLIRRLSYDLIGLPPTPEEVLSFVEDKEPRAYERLVDRLLDSPHYGERWARHWFDVIRFGETHGFEYNQPRNNAWPYKNWVVDALNRDIPYDEFVRLQLAGDVYSPDGEGIVSTGFLVAGPHNTTLPSSDKMRKTMRQDEMEDLIATVGQTFLGLTANCGRCHDHKFDPISQKDYYRLSSALSGVKHGDRDFVTGEALKARQRMKVLDARRLELGSKLSSIEESARRKLIDEKQAAGDESQATIANLPRPIASWSFDGNLQDLTGKLHAELVDGARLVAGALRVDGKSYARSVPLDRDVAAKTLEAWVQLSGLDQRGGAAISLQTRGGSVFDAIVFGERDARQWMAGSNGFVRTKSFSAPQENVAHERPVHVALTYSVDGTITAYREGQVYGRPYKTSQPVNFKAGESEVIFGLRHSPTGNGRNLSGSIFKAQLYDRALTADEIAKSASTGPASVKFADVIAAFDAETKAEYDSIKSDLTKLDAERKKLSGYRSSKVYTNVSRKVPKVHLLDRGDVTAPKESVMPGGVAALRGTAWDFKLDENASDKDRRKKLAEWITDPSNPLFARVIVNRLWHHHFGRGLVGTPNDFGFNGGVPTHPELLDWLAAQMQSEKWSQKAMHRIMVTSATYRQASRAKSKVESDVDNLLLWRANPRRLEAEAIRDSMLHVSGILDATVGGSGYRDVRHYQHKGSNFYDPIDQSEPQFNRRTVYRFVPRGGRRTMLDTFDCPDPSAATPDRAVTTTPLQALSLLNNSLVLRLADEFAARLKREAGEQASAQVALAYRLAYARSAVQDEVDAAQTFVADHGLAAFCRVIFNTNEFLYVR